MKLALVGLFLSTTAAGEPRATARAPSRAIDVVAMHGQDCALAREPILQLRARCTTWQCGEYPPDTTRACMLHWDPDDTTTTPGRRQSRPPKDFLVEILRSAEDL